MSSLFSNSRIIKLNSIDSTNNYARSIIGKSDNEPLVVVTSEQTNGRGQQGNSWHSEKNKNLTFSIVIYPHFINADEQFLLNKVVSLSVKCFLEKILKSIVTIKWPNDIYVENKKIAGILIEHSVMENKLIHSVIGIGINVNQTVFPDNIPNPVSMKILSGIEYNIDECLHVFLDTFQEIFMSLFDGDVSLLNKSYLESLYRYGLKCKFIYNKSLITATIKNVDKFGRLILEDEEKKQIYCSFKEINFVL